jgi:hypothetical protein
MEFDHEFGPVAKQSLVHALQYLQLHSLDVDFHAIDPTFSERRPPIVEADDVDVLGALSAETVIGHASVDRD